MTAPVAANGSAPKPSQFSEQGTAIDHGRLFVDYQDGRVFEPRDFTPRIVDEMLRRDGKARAIEQALTLPARGATWSIEAADGDRGEADFVRNALTRPANSGGMSTPFELVVSQAISACLYRRACFEKQLKVDPESGRVVYDKIAYRPPATCQPIVSLPQGTFGGFRQWVGSENPHADDTGHVTIEPQKAFVFVYGQHRRPVEGLSDLDAVVSLYETKQKIRFLWMTFLENMTMPKAVAKDNSNDPAQIQALAKKVATLKGGGVVGIGSDQDVSAFETSTAAADAFERALRYLDSEMSGSVLAGMLDLTAAAGSGRGSYALSRDASDLFLLSRQALLTELAAAITSWIVADLVRYNFGPRAAVPVFRFAPLKGEDVQTSVTLLQAFATAPQTTVPREFIDQLTTKVAGYLDLDSDRVAKAIKDEAAQAPAGPAQIQAGTDAALQLLQSLPQGG